MRAADEAALRQAAAELQHGDYSGAESILRAELKIHPADADALSMLGMVLDARKGIHRGGRTLSQSHSGGSHSVPVLGRYANHLLAAGAAKGAHDAFERVVAIASRRSVRQPGTRPPGIKEQGRGARERSASISRSSARRYARGAPEAAVPRLIALDRGGDTKAAEAPGYAIIQCHSERCQTEFIDRLDPGPGGTVRSGRNSTFLAHALAGDPSNFQLLYDVGVVALYAHHYERAREVLEKGGSRATSKRADALYSLAFVYSSLKQPESALRLLAEAAKIAPKPRRCSAADRRDHLASYGRTKTPPQPGTAMPRWRRNDDTARRERGFTHPHAPVRYWYRPTWNGTSRGIRATRPTGPPRVGRCAEHERSHEGLSSLDKALQLKPDFVEARSARGALYYLQGKPEAAVPDLETAAASQLDNGLILDRLGQGFSRARPPRRVASEPCAERLQLSPDEPTIVLHLANALAEAGKDSGIGNAHGELSPDAPNADSARSDALSQPYAGTAARRLSRARGERQSTTIQRPDAANAQLHYLKLSLEDGRTEQALATRPHSWRSLKA